jgi:hypothetical protein
MNDVDVIDQVVLLAADADRWSGEAVAGFLGREGWEPRRPATGSYPIWWGSGEIVVGIYEVEHEVCLEVTFASWEVDLDGGYEELDRALGQARDRVDRLGSLFGARAGGEWRGGEAVRSEFDDEFGADHQVDWRAGRLSVVIGVRHEDKELPVRAVLRVYNT